MRSNSKIITSQKIHLGTNNNQQPSSPRCLSAGSSTSESTLKRNSNNHALTGSNSSGNLLELKGLQCKESNDNVFSPRLLSNYGQNIRTPGSPRTPRQSSARDSSNGTPKKFTINLNQVQARAVKHVRLDQHSDLEKIYRIHQEPIGKGSYGTVYRAETRTRLTSASSNHSLSYTSSSTEPLQSWAIKKIQKSEAGKTERFKLLEREVNILKKVTHKNIIHLEAVYETSDHMYLVTELCIEGELKEYLKKHVKLNEPETRTIIKQLSDSLMYLHQYGVVHRDIKLENILVKTEKRPVRNSSLSSNSSSTSMESLTSNGTSFLSRKHTSLVPRHKLHSTPDEETSTNSPSVSSSSTSRRRHSLYPTLPKEAHHRVESLYASPNSSRQHKNKISPKIDNKATVWNSNCVLLDSGIFLTKMSNLWFLYLSFLNNIPKAQPISPFFSLGKTRLYRNRNKINRFWPVRGPWRSHWRKHAHDLLRYTSLYGTGSHTKSRLQSNL